MVQAKNKPSTKEIIMQVAQDLMLEKGYVATTVDEICEGAKLTKGSFFHYFKSKEDLAKALLTRTCDKVQKSKDELFGLNPIARVLGQIDMAIEMSLSAEGQKGCLKGTLAHELSDTHPQVRKICVAHFDQMAKDFADDLAKAKAISPKSLPFDSLALARHYIAIIQGSLILTKAYDNADFMANNLRLFRGHVCLLLGLGEKHQVRK